MPTRSLRWRGFRVDVTVPDRGRADHADARAATPKLGALEFRDPPATLDVKQRSIEAALAFRDVADEKGQEHAEDAGWTGDDELTKLIRSISWYHTIELPGGVVTPGQFDHRELLPHYGFPESLAGKRALDVATFNGFWAFHMERLGAEVTAIDLDDPAEWDFPTLVKPSVEPRGPEDRIGSGFEIAHQALNSTVNRIGRSVYDLDPAEVGTFDFVHCGDVLVHLRNPLLALEKIRSVTSGELLLSDGVDLSFERGSFGPTMQYLGGWTDVVWWVPSIGALAQMVVDAGFRDVRINTVYNLAKTYETTGFWRASISAVV
jgi:tRNA (mo5U34)-methyltransferase